MKIYTKSGDKGKTSLFDGTRVLKSNIRVETYGTIDELNSIIGIVTVESQKSKIKSQKQKLKIKNELQHIQNDLLDIGSMLANPNTSSNSNGEVTTYFEKRVKDFEELIDEMTDQLPELSNFILPGGGRTGAVLHLARTVCRRVERRIIALSQEVAVEKGIIMYFNRLSDLLFTMSRFVNFQEGQEELVWKKNT